MHFGIESLKTIQRGRASQHQGRHETVHLVGFQIAQCFPGLVEKTQTDVFLSWPT